MMTEQQNRLVSPPCRATEVAGCSTVLTRSNSDKSALTVDSCKDALDDCRVWTNEKHNSYLNQLEVSFVTHLQQSKGLVRKSYELKDRNIHMSQNDPTNAHNSSRQFTVLRNGCWQNVKSERAELLSHTSADSCRQTKNACHPPSIDIGVFVKPSGTNKHRKGIVCQGLASYEQRCSTSNLYQKQRFEITREGTGQNFSEEDDRAKADTESQTKRLKTDFASSPILDQVVPQDMSNGKCQVIDNLNN